MSNTPWMISLPSNPMVVGFFVTKTDQIGNPSSLTKWKWNVGLTAMRSFRALDGL